MGKGSFILYDSDLKALEFLTDNQAGKLFKALAKLRLGGEAPKLGTNPAVNILFNQIREHIAINEEKYEEICKKRTEAANKRWNSDMQKDANASKSMQLHANGCLYDNDNENDIDNVIVNDNDAFGAKRENKRKNYYGKKQPSAFKSEPSYDMEAFTRKAIGLKYEKKEKATPKDCLD